MCRGCVLHEHPKLSEVIHHCGITGGITGVPIEQHVAAKVAELIKLRQLQTRPRKGLL